MGDLAVWTDLSVQSFKSVSKVAYDPERAPLVRTLQINAPLANSQDEPMKWNRDADGTLLLFGGPFEAWLDILRQFRNCRVLNIYLTDVTIHYRPGLLTQDELFIVALTLASDAKFHLEALILDSNTRHFDPPAPTPDYGVDMARLFSRLNLMVVKSDLQMDALRSFIPQVMRYANGLRSLTIDCRGSDDLTSSSFFNRILSAKPKFKLDKLVLKGGMFKSGTSPLSLLSRHCGANLRVVEFLSVQIEDEGQWTMVLGGLAADFKGLKSLDLARLLEGRDAASVRCLQWPSELNPLVQGRKFGPVFTNAGWVGHEVGGSKVIVQISHHETGTMTAAVEKLLESAKMA
ncbi:hypothetical protein BJX70DRAFT_395394 [Aspergillus crustosus]